MLKFFNKLDNNEYELTLSGDFGSDINCKQIADEIRYLNTIGATKIIERINSSGGSVIPAFDIIDANIQSQAIIETIIIGISASTAGWIAASGTKGYRKILDYGKGMVHDPALFGITLNEMAESKSKTALLNIKDSIVTIFSNMTGKTKEEISLLMTNETWYDAEGWVQEGFADKVINTVKKPILTENMSIANMVNACENFAKDIKLNKVTMDKLTNHFKLVVGSNEDEVLNAIKVIENDNKDLKAENTTLIEVKDTLTTENSDLKANEIAQQTIIDGFKDAEKVNNTEKVLAIINKGIEDGKFKKDDTEKFVNLFGEDFEKAKAVIDCLIIPVANILGHINTEGHELIPENCKNWTIRDWEKKDSKGLENIKDKFPELYNKMYKDTYNVEFEKD